MSITEPNVGPHGTAVYQVTWNPGFFETPSREEGGLSTWLRRQAWLGTTSLFFSYLRTSFPKAFVLTNLAESLGKARKTPDVVGLNPADVLSECARVDVEWDYGFGGPGRAIKGARASIIEIADHNPILSLLIGLAPNEVSSVLMLGAGDVDLATMQNTMNAARNPEEWEARVLSQVAILGYPHEEAMYTVKTRSREAERVLFDLRPNTLTGSVRTRNGCHGV